MRRQYHYSGPLGMARERKEWGLKEVSASPASVSAGGEVSVHDTRGVDKREKNDLLKN